MRALNNRVTVACTGMIVTAFVGSTLASVPTEPSGADIYDMAFRTERRHHQQTLRLPSITEML